MHSTVLKDIFHTPRPLIGMIHLPPLPGAPRHRSAVSEIKKQVVADAQALARGGAHGIILENYGDTPFYPERVPASVVAHMTALALEVRQQCDAPLGINVLRNDGRSALAVAHAVGAEFIRVNILCGARVTDQGIIQGVAHDLLRDRAQLGATSIRIFADVNVKHSAAITPQPLEVEIADTLHRGGADGVIVSGEGTGRAVNVEELCQAASATGDAPLLVGSGVTLDSIAELLHYADGFIVGTSLKQDGVVENPIDQERVERLVAALR